MNYKSLLYILPLMYSCTEYIPTNYSKLKQREYQDNKLECICESLAINTNYYGMGNTNTRTTDGKVFDNWEPIYYAYKHNSLRETIEVKDAWWVLLETNPIYCDKNGGGYSKVDMPGFNNDESQGRCIYIDYAEQRVNYSWCPDPIYHHNPYFVYLTDEYYTFVEIHATDSYDEDVICKVYATFNYNPSTTYLLCIEDLGGSCLDFNDVVILGIKDENPKIIYRMASLPMDITIGNDSYLLPGDMYGDYNITLPFNSMNYPSDWSDAVFKSNGVVIPVLLNRVDDMPAVIATDITYQFHRDENTMTSSEFINIPFWK